MKDQIITNKILNWYDINKRVLPWRKKVSHKKKQYYTLVSEFMLQQTQVATVIPYFNRFIKNIPDLETLANFENQKLIKLWEGLGYYSRARNLKKTALLVIKKFDNVGKIHLGGIPMIADDMMSFIKNDIVVFGLGVLIFIILIGLVIFFIVLLLPL